MIPGRSSRRSDLRGGNESSVESLKDDSGNDETCRFSSEGREWNMSVNNRESIVPPGLQWRKSVRSLDQFE